MTVVYISQKQLAERWALRPKTLERWRSDGNGPRFLKLGFGKGARVVYRLSDVEEYETACFNAMPAAARAVGSLIPGEPAT